jgi:hypothetical protein
MKIRPLKTPAKSTPAIGESDGELGNMVTVCAVVATETWNVWVPPLSVTGGGVVQVDSAGAPKQANEMVSVVPGSEAIVMLKVTVCPAVILRLPPFKLNL